MVPVSSAICTSRTWQGAVVPLLPLPELLSFVMTGISLLISITNQVYEYVLVYFLNIHVWQFYLHAAPPSNFWINWPVSVSSARSMGCLWAAAPPPPAAAIRGQPARWGELLCATDGNGWGVLASPGAELQSWRHGRIPVCSKGPVQHCSFVAVLPPELGLCSSGFVGKLMSFTCPYHMLFLF